MYQTTFIDVSQFAAEPLRTGVQRVLAKCIEHMPRGKIIPFRVVDAHHAAILDPALFDLIVRYFRGQAESERGRIAAAQGQPRPSTEEELLIKLMAHRPLAVLQAGRFFSRAQRIINLEAFSSAERSRFYISCDKAQRAKVFHFIHDFLLYESPGVFPQLNWRYASDYVLLFEAYCCAGGYFVSTPAMAQRVAEYFNRPMADVKVVHFGGDIMGMGPPPEPPQAPRRRRVTVVGTLEPRKHPLTVMEALDQVAEANAHVDCAAVGNWGWVDAETRGKIDAIFTRGRVQHQVNVGDADMAELIRDTDVGIYVSSAEGFGIPVIEFAALGIPVITSAAVPASALIESPKRTVLEVVDVQGLVGAIGASLAKPHDRKPYYTWTWKDCAKEIFEWEPAGAAAPDIDGRAIACWRAATQMVKELRRQKLDWEALKAAVRLRIANDPRLAPISKTVATHGKAGMNTLVERMSEIVSDNLNRIFWADFIHIRPLLSTLVRCLAAENVFDGISRAFTAFLGREIDGRAASEAVRLRDRTRAFERIVELIHSHEALQYLGEITATPLQSVVDDIRPMVATCLAEQLDLFHLMALLGLPPPSLQEVMRAEHFIASRVDRLEILLYFANGRSLVGDGLDLFLEETARVFRERGPRVTLGAVAVPPPAVAAPAPSPPSPVVAPLSSSTPDVVPLSFMHEVPIASDAYRDGWYPVEYAGENAFRWMGRKGIVMNPAKSRPVRDFILDVQDVYGAHEPMVAGFVGKAPLEVRIESRPDKKGWSLHLGSVGAGSQLIESVRLEALACDSPAKAEGLPDERELSFCVTGATFIYRD